MSVEDLSRIIRSLPKELLEAMNNPIIINEIGEEITDMNDLESFKYIIKNPADYMPKVKTQMNFVLPDLLINSNEPYIVNIRKDLNFYRNWYEIEAKKINTIVNKAIESTKIIYPLAQNLEDDIKSYTKNFIDSIYKIQIPLTNKRLGLNDINSEQFSEERKVKFINDKSNIINKIIIFYNDVNKFLNDFSENTKLNCDKIEEVICRFIEMPKSVKALSEYMSKIIEKFERSNKDFNDLSNQEKINNNFKNYTKFLNDLSDMEKNAETLDSNAKFEEKELEQQNIKIQELKKELDEMKDTLKNKSNEISEDINKIRKKYGEPERKLEDFGELKSIQVTSIEDIKKETDKAKEELQQRIKEANEALKKNILEAEKYSRLDLLFIMDITNSMDIYLEAIKSQILRIISGIKKKCANINIFSGFIGYKDFNDLQFGDQYVNIELTDDYNSIEQNIKYSKASGGGDTAEDLCGALELGCNKSWKGKSRFAILVTDSPCHGRQYYDIIEDNYDNYPEGDPNNRNIEDFIKYFAENEISLFCLKINQATDKMFKIFEEVYNKNKKENSNNKFSAESANNLIDVIISNAINTFHNSKEMEIIE